MGVGALPPGGRLRKRSEFLAAGRGRRFHTERMTVQGRPSEACGPDGDGLRIGLTITRKVGHSTERNRIRRRLRVVGATLLLERDPGAIALDVVVIARREAITAPFPVLLDDLRRGLAAVARPSSPKRGAEPARRPEPARPASVL